MLEVSIHREADRKAVVDQLKKFGPIVERNVVSRVVGVETSIQNMDQIRRITGVIDVEDGEQMNSGFSQTHTVTAPVGPNGTCDIFALQALGFEPQRMGFDVRYKNTVISRTGSNDGAGVVIGVADNLMSNSGHSEFTGRFDGTTVYNGYPSDAIHPHGNWVASAAAGASFGIAPGATLINARGLNANNQGSTSILVNAMDAIGNEHDIGSDQHICNCSFGGSSSSFNAVVTDLADSGVPVICAVGNSGTDLGSATILPAESANAFAVGGCTIWKQVDSRSNYGTPVDVYAGYGPHWLVDDTGTFGERNGTSFAAPIVCGIAALLLQGRTRMTTLQETLDFYDELRGIAVNDILDRDGNTDTSLLRIEYNLAASEYTISRS